MEHCRGAENNFVFLCLFFGLLMAQKKSFFFEKSLSGDKNDCPI
jgi:hypothetical protein